jgi:hypothetical protein
MVSDRLQPTLLSSTSNTSLPTHRTPERARRSAESARLRVAEIPTVNDTAPARQGLDRAPWECMLTATRARLTRAPRGARCSPHTAARNLALIQKLAGAAPRFTKRAPCPPTRSRKPARTTRAARCTRACTTRATRSARWAPHRRRRRARALARAARRDPRAGRRPDPVPAARPPPERRLIPGRRRTATHTAPIRIAATAARDRCRCPTTPPRLSPFAHGDHPLAATTSDCGRRAAAVKVTSVPAFAGAPPGLPYGQVLVQLA